MIIRTQAPSNIALIKYMGKKDSEKDLGRNIPENPSVSMTLDSLRTVVEITGVKDSGENSGIQWFAEPPRGLNTSFEIPKLAEMGIAKVIKHAERVRNELSKISQMSGIEISRELKSFEIRSANSFPSASGIASSASSFAAMTLGFGLAYAKDADAFRDAFREDLSFKRALASISRMGSGSSCRSFEGPFVLWDDEDTKSLKTSMPTMAHFVILVSKEEKAVSSSRAHQEVKSSPLWNGRPARARHRCLELKQALSQGDLDKVAALAWTDSWEMHSLFHTSREPFSYWKPETLGALQYFSTFFARASREVPPIVTLDAGPNVHVIVPESEREPWRERLEQRFGSGSFLEDGEGKGAAILETF